jgi:hypothetical protein
MVAALDRHPEVLIFAFGIALLLLAVAVACLLDLFLSFAEPDDAEAPPAPRPSAALTDQERDALMASHADVVRRHLRPPSAPVGADPGRSIR